MDDTHQTTHHHKMTYRINTVDSTDEEAWNDLLCSQKCMRLAILTIDGVPYCEQCAELQFEYDLARSINPDIVRVLLAPDVRD